jgi:RNA-binding protein
MIRQDVQVTITTDTEQLIAAMDKKNTEIEKIRLTGKEKKQLRGLGHHLNPVVYVGREGITSTVLKATGEALAARELIKVKLGQNCPLGKKQAAEQLALRSEAALVQLTGKTVLLYLPNPDLAPGKQIILSAT